MLVLRPNPSFVFRFFSSFVLLGPTVWLVLCTRASLLFPFPLIFSLLLLLSLLASCSRSAIYLFLPARLVPGLGEVARDRSCLGAHALGRREEER